MFTLKPQLGAALVLLLTGSLNAQVDSRGSLPQRSGYPAPGAAREYPGASQAVALTPREIDRLREFTNVMESSLRDPFKRAYSRKDRERDTNLDQVYSRYDGDRLEMIRVLLREQQREFYSRPVSSWAEPESRELRSLDPIRNEEIRRLLTPRR